MPLPLLIGLAVVTGGVGIAKGIGAADTQSKANDINEKAQDIVDLAKEKMEFSRVICTHFPGHILFTSLNTWMLPCILQGASILFFSESFYHCNS